MKRFALVATVLALCVALCGCAGIRSTQQGQDSSSESSAQSTAQSSSSSSSSSSSASSGSSTAKKVDYTTGIHHALVTIKGYDTPIEFEIYSDSAPQTSLKFSQLVKSGYYNGKTLFWVLDGIYMKLGSKKQDDSNLITGEYADSDYTNSNSLKKGVIALARAEDGEQSDASTIIIFLSDYEVIEDIMARTQSSSDDSRHISTESNGKISKSSQCPVIKSIKMED